jgi:hypothetical protein
MGETTKEGAAIKKELNEIKADNERFMAKKENKNSSMTQIRINLYQTHIRRFHQVMNAYQQASYDFRKHLKDRTRRQLAVVANQLSPGESGRARDCARPRSRARVPRRASRADCGGRARGQDHWRRDDGRGHKPRA